MAASDFLAVMEGLLDFGVMEEWTIRLLHCHPFPWGRDTITSEPARAHETDGTPWDTGTTCELP
ncbi:hypothetical protein GCM10009839_09940 [Catenulispora yoronensis]|uniref:Uncharacterized protein n=1 Tax=Catenulispora yoronensis TaxID=450799 RepID=A0ABN2TQG0_9ACTN